MIERKKSMLILKSFLLAEKVEIKNLLCMFMLEKTRFRKNHQQMYNFFVTSVVERKIEMITAWNVGKIVDFAILN